MESAKLAQELRELRITLDRATHDARARWNVRLHTFAVLIALYLSDYTQPPYSFLSPCSIAAESARAVAAAEGQVRALELEASEAKRDAGKPIACKKSKHDRRE